MKLILTMFLTFLSVNALAENFSGAYAGPENSYYQVNHMKDSGVVVATALGSDLTYETFLGQMDTATSTATLDSVLANVAAKISVEFNEIGATITVLSCDDNDEFVCTIPPGFSFQIVKIL